MQDISTDVAGLDTGEVSANMVVNMGAKYVILGHSERRKELSENYEMVSKKIFAAIRNDLTPILCFGSNNIYIEQEKQCQFSQEQKKCLSTIKRTLYSQIPEFDSIKLDYPSFERIAKYDDEGAAIIIENTAPEIVLGNTKFNLRFSI